MGLIVLALAAVLVVCALAVRIWVAASGNFYSDDLIFAGRASLHSILSTDYLFHDQDGHFMPGAFALAGSVSKLSPLHWTLPAVTLVVMQLLASLAVVRLLVLLCGRRPIMLAPLAFYLFSPLSLPSFAWWAAAVNALPLQIALAWVAGDAIRLYRTGRVRYAISGAMAFTVSLLFFEKSVLVPLFAFAVVALAARTDGEPHPVHRVWKAGRKLWVPVLIITALWAVAYLVVVQSPISTDSLHMGLGLLQHGIFLGVLPTMLGGPWQWERWQPSPPWAAPPTVLVIASCVAVIAALALSVRFKKGTLPVWAALAAYVLVSALAMVVARSGPDTSLELAQTLRYFADSAVAVSVAAALILRAPDRTERRASAAGPTRAAAIGLVAVFVLGSLGSTWSFTRSWRQNGTADFLATARESLAAHRDAPILDFPISAEILLPVGYPDNMASHVFAPFRDRPEFAASTTVLRTMDNAGHVVDGAVGPIREIPPGPDPVCGYRIGDRGVRIPLSGPLIGWEWTAQLNYLSDRDGTIAVALGDGDDVDVPVRKGLGTAYVRLIGSGDSVRVRTTDAANSLCLGSGPVGGVLPVLPKG